MKTQVHPVIAVVVILLALVAVWFVYTRVFTGQVEGTIGPPSGASLPPPPTAGASDMPKRTKQTPSDTSKGEKETTPSKPH